MRHSRDGHEPYTRFELVLLAISFAAATFALVGLASATPIRGGEPSTGTAIEIWSFRGEPVAWRRAGGFRSEITQVAHSDLVGTVSAPAVGTGTIFRGWQIGRRLVGRAEMSVEGCPLAFTYTVRGWVSPAGDRAVLTGASPRIRDCRIVGENPFGAGSTILLERIGIASAPAD
ncbi:MAG: hypothetical protein GC150_15135 [Rhizobiales bacterium]|nr:hypothetical protein [Hyphomicrobiales bacterium]